MTVHPTIDEQLHGAQRILDALEADAGLSAASRESLINVRRLLRQVGRSWAGLLPFRVEDNANLTALLARIAPLVGPALSSELGVAMNAEPGGAGMDVAAVTDRSTELRGLLSRVIAELPRTVDGDTARTEIGGYLRRRVDADPT